MDLVVMRSLMGFRWRSRALLRSLGTSSRRRLSPPGMALAKLELPSRSLALIADNFLMPVDFLPDSTSFAGSPVDQVPPRALDEQTGPVVVAPLKDGRWMVMHGEREVATALETGKPAIEAQVIPVNEALAGVGDRQKTFYPPRLYRKNLQLLENLGVPASELDPDLLALANEIREKPLVSMAQLYQPLPFPEFQDLTVQADNVASYTRLGMILDKLGNPEGKKVLDLGCNVGFFMFSLAGRGCQVSGLDLDARFVEVGQQVAAAKEIDAQFVAAALEPDAFDPGGALRELRDHPAHDPENRPWDLVTCFSMLQWVAKDHDLDYCRRILKEISGHTRALLVDIPVNCSGVHMKAPPGREKAWLEGFLKESCDFKEYVCLGSVAPYKVDDRYVFFCHH